MNVRLVRIMGRPRKERNICPVEGCDKIAQIREYCEPHYRRFMRYGDPVAGHRSPGMAIKFLKEVVLKFESEECLHWPFIINNFGYPVFRLGKMQYVANAVCRFKHGEPPTDKHQAAHNCGNRACVNPRHLRWATPAENSDDKYKHGTQQNGERNPSVKLTELQVLEIMSLVGTMPQGQIAKRFGVDRKCVNNIYRGKSWMHLPRPEGWPPARHPRYRSKLYPEICRYT